MTDPDNFLSRWSRRKQEAAKQSSLPARVEDASQKAAHASEEGTERSPTSPASNQVDPAFDLENLPSLESIGPLTEQMGISPLRGQTFGSTNASYFTRPQHTVNLDSNYFKSMGEQTHEFKFGFGWRKTDIYSRTIYPGNGVVAYENSATDFRARVYREGAGTNRAQYLNARNTLERLLSLGVVPIVNENDTVVVDEFRLGGNDELAAIVSHLVTAGILVILTDTGGIYSADPRTMDDVELLSAVDSADAALDDITAGEPGPYGSGGAATKVLAARMAAWSA